MALMFFVSSDGRSKASQTGRLNCRHCLLPVLEAESWRSRCGQVGPPEASLGCGCHLLPVSSQGLPSVGVCVPISSYKECLNQSCAVELL